MDKEGDVNQNRSGNDNIQINSGGDVISAVGDGAIAAGGNITINNIQGVPQEVHNQALEMIENLKKEINELKNSSDGKEDKIISEKIVDNAAKLEELVDVEYPISILFQLAEAAIKVGKYNSAEKYLLESISQSKLIKDETQKSWGYNGLTTLEMSRGNFQKAKYYAEKMVPTDPFSHASKLLNIGQIECRTGNYSEGKKRVTEALHIYEEVGHIQGISYALNSLGNIAIYDQDFDSAIHFLNRSKDIKMRIGDIYAACNSMINIARMHRKLGRLEEALRILHECLTITEHHDWTPFSSNIYNNIGNIFLDKEDYEKAEFNFNKSLELNRKNGDAVGIGLCKQNLGSLAINRRDLDLAEKLLMESKIILEENNSEHLQATLRGLDMIRQLRGF